MQTQEYECSVRFTYNTWNPAEAGINFLVHLRQPGICWFVRVKNTKTGQIFTYDNELHELEHNENHLEVHDGEMYWLGAIWMRYNHDTDSFDGGNHFIARAQTWYKDATPHLPATSPAPTDAAADQTNRDAKTTP